MDSSNSRQRLLAIVPKLNNWQTLFLLKLAQILEWLVFFKNPSESDSTQSNLPVLSITPIVPGSGFTDTSLNHDLVLAEHGEILAE